MSEREGVRLAKRVAELRGCSRREAELLIEGGWVRVSGRVVETPQQRVQDEAVTVDPGARAEPLAPVTMVLHKPAGMAAGPAQALLGEATRFAGDRSGLRLLQRHLRGLELVAPLDEMASGLVVFTQDARVRRKLLEDAAWVEHELIAELAGAVAPQILPQLERQTGARVSLSRQTAEGSGLRFALKGYQPGQIAQACATAGLQLLGLRRLRISRIPLAGLPSGQWRYLLPSERF